MATKTVALDEEAYELLRGQKKADESFSDAVKRLARPRRPLSEFAGMWSNMTKKEREEMDRVYSGLRKADRLHAERVRKAWK
jgi:predicted CopG family antitoxin